ncbi:unnamed protein product, partial [Allacma fusca]
PLQDLCHFLNFSGVGILGQRTLDPVNANIDDTDDRDLAELQPLTGFGISDGPPVTDVSELTCLTTRFDQLLAEN